MRIPVWFLAILIAVSLTSSADSSGICTQDCIVEITGLQASYGHGAKVEFALENMSRRDIIVVVALDGFYAGEWHEEFPSVFDPKHPLAKVVLAKRMKPGERAKCSFDPVAILSAKARVVGYRSKADSYRLRALIHDDKGPLQTVISNAFRLSGADVPPG
jgi:hypothetical protein